MKTEQIHKEPRKVTADRCIPGQCYVIPDHTIYQCTTGGMVRLADGTLFGYTYYTEGAGRSIQFTPVESEVHWSLL